nr:nuclear transport factor 2 family protein [Vibrio sonorensis]
MDILIEQETALHQYDVRQNISEIERLLHPSFVEVGESGRSYNLETIIEMMKEERPSLAKIHSQEFQSIALEPSVHLLLYKSAVIDASGRVSHFAKRSSIWAFTGMNWQLKYHQARPARHLSWNSQRTIC